MRKTGLQMLLSQLGIEIDPQEIMTKYNEAKEIMPKLAVFVNQLDARLARIEETQAFIAAHLGMEKKQDDTGRISAAGIG